MHLFAKARHVLAFVAASPEDPMKSIMLSFMALFLLLSPSARAQGVGASGQIKGTVFDPSGSVIPSATVEAVDTAKGTRYTAVSDVTGQYQFAILPPSTWLSSGIQSTSIPLRVVVVFTISSDFWRSFNHSTSSGFNRL